MNTEDERLKEIAYHEAGHAVAGITLNRTISYATIEAEGGSEGRCAFGDRETGLTPEFFASPEGRKRLHDELVCSLAGRLAQERFTGKRHAGDAGRDRDDQRLTAVRALGTLEELRVLFGHEGTDDEKRRVKRELYLKSSNYIAEAEDEAASLVASQWAAIQRVAEQLLVHRRLDGDTIVQIVGSR